MNDYRKKAEQELFEAEIREATEAARRRKMMDESLVEEERDAGKKDDDIYELLKAVVTAAFIALVIRSFLFEPFNIPSGSLLPTLQIGDYLFVEKYAYGYGKYSFPFGLIDFDGRVMGAMPKRGDIAVFRQPKKTGVDYIKRIVGLPGDAIQVKDGILHINGQPVTRDFRNIENVNDDGRSAMYKRYVEKLPNGVKHYIYEISDDAKYDNTPVYIVPPEHYFAMGDNRDSSLDSRAQNDVGFIPAQNLIGRAWFIFFSTEGVGNTCDRDGSLAFARSLGCKLMKWPKVIRYSRFLKKVHKI
jgi:signal peptidase I